MSRSEISSRLIVITYKDLLKSIFDCAYGLASTSKHKS